MEFIEAIVKEEIMYQTNIKCRATEKDEDIRVSVSD